MSINARRVARVHKLLGLVVGFQLLFWTVSGLFFTLFPIEQIRGEHLRKPAPMVDIASLETLAPPQVTGDAKAVQLRQVLGRPVWEVSGDGWTALYEASTGEQLSPLGETAVRRIAEEAWAGRGYATTVERIDHPPREAFTGKPLWRVEFEGLDSAVFWVDAEAAKITAVRTTLALSHHGYHRRRPVRFLVAESLRLSRTDQRPVRLCPAHPARQQGPAPEIEKASAGSVQRPSSSISKVRFEESDRS
jgi:hypothetical protein